MLGLLPLINRDRREMTLSLGHVRIQQNGRIVDSLPSTLIMDFPDSRTVINKYI